MVVVIGDVLGGSMEGGGAGVTPITRKSKFVLTVSYYLKRHGSN